MHRHHDQISILRPRAALSAFAREERGSLAILGLFMFILMMIAAGIAMDIMRNERERAELQIAVDGAVLAAADVDQERSAEDVAYSWIETAGFRRDQVDVIPLPNDEGEFSPRERNVRIETAAITDNLFLDLLDYPELYQPISTEARESRSKLEVSLVLDISGSMSKAAGANTTTTKIEELQVAAKNFLFELLDGREDLTTVSLIPYHETVNMGETLASVFTLSKEHSFANCSVFQSSDYDYLPIREENVNEDWRIIRRAFFDYRTYDTSEVEGLVKNSTCPPAGTAIFNSNQIIPWSNNITTLNAAIDGMTAKYSTAIDHGVKWGVALLDPSSQDELGLLVNDPDVPPALQIDPNFVGRPAAYDDQFTSKILVVMTDGANNKQFDMADEYKSGPSAVWVWRKPKNVSGGSAPERTVENGGVNGLDEINGWFCNVPSAGPNAPCTGSYYDDRTAVDLVYSVYSPARGQFRWYSTDADLFDTQGDGGSHASGWKDHPYGFASASDYQAYEDDNAFTTWTSLDSAYPGIPPLRLSWPQVWATMTTENDGGNSYSYSNRSFFTDVIAKNIDNRTRREWRNAILWTDSPTDADQNLANICERAREAGIEVYTMAFEAPDEGKAAMSNCVGVNLNDGSNTGDAARYFEVGAGGFQTAFDSILASISRLRLNQ